MIVFEEKQKQRCGYVPKNRSSNLKELFKNNDCKKYLIFHGWNNWNSRKIRNRLAEKKLKEIQE